MLQCFLSSFFIYWIYLSVGTSKQIWLVLHFSQAFHSTCSCLSIQFFISDLYLFRDSGRWDSGPIGLVLTSFLANQFAVSFYIMPLCLGVHNMDTWFFSDSAVNFSLQSTTSSDLITHAPAL